MRERLAQMIHPVLLSLVSAATALVASFAGPFVTFRIGRAQIKATVLSTNRQRWIDGFRELVAALCSQVAVVVQVREKMIKEGKSTPDEPEILLHFERLVFTFTKIRLMINPLEEDRQMLLDTMQKLLTTIRTAPLC
jgi:hypothetical protein